MLKIVVPVSPERWDEETEEFEDGQSRVLQLEHSLLSLSKWEAKYKKPFLSQMEMTDEENMDYIKFMTITPNVDPDVYNHLTEKNVEDIIQYIKDPMTATTFADDKKSKNSRRVVTAELIYHWMIAMQIPIKFEKWHLNRLMTLIRVCEAENNPPKKRSQRDLMKRNTSLNAARRARLNSKG